MAIAIFRGWTMEYGIWHKDMAIRNLAMKVIDIFKEKVSLKFQRKL